MADLRRLSPLDAVETAINGLRDDWLDSMIGVVEAGCRIWIVAHALLVYCESAKKVGDLRMELMMSRPDNAFFRLFSKINEVSLVETGTQHGKGLREFIACGFKKVHSIEAFKQYYENCSRVFERDIKSGVVTLHFGPSETELSKVIASIQGPIVYWLDAHFQGTEIDAKHCPLDDEVNAILGRGIKADDVILIDDIRLVVQQRAWRGHDVDFNQIVGRLIVTAPNHFCCFVRGHVVNDVFCLVPKTMASDFFDVVKSLGAIEHQEQAPLVA